MTLSEINRVLSENYTSEELVDMLDITPQDLVEEFQENIYHRQEKIEAIISEDLGYDEDTDD